MPNELNNPSELDELTKSLLMRCEASSLKEFYLKWVQENQHVVSIKKTCTLHKNFNESKVIQDLADIPEILTINIPNYFNKHHNTHLLTREKFLIDHEALPRILSTFKKFGLLKKTISIKSLCEKLGLVENQPSQRKQLIYLIQLAINSGLIYGELNDYDLVFHPKIIHPEHRKELILLLITIIVAAASISILLPIIFIINT